jgi:phosphoribosylformylglycinamidine synthase subunit PurQ / glutaminase
MTPNVLIVRAAGSNCDEETEYAFKLASAETQRLHVNRLAEDPSVLEKAHIFVIPGGFTYGDDVSAGTVLANELMTRLAEPLHRFVERGGLVLGICNGFQVLVKTGLLPGWNGDTASVTLADNLSGKFEDRWVMLESASSTCAFTQGIDEPIYLPVAHAEGRFTATSDDVLDRLETGNQIAFRYVTKDGGPVEYPWNPNGADRDIAGICDPTGRVMGLMPHPERHVHPTHHPQWTRKNATVEGEGLVVFRNAVEAARQTG